MSLESCVICLLSSSCADSTSSRLLRSSFSVAANAKTLLSMLSVKMTAIVRMKDFLLCNFISFPLCIFFLYLLCFVIVVLALVLVHRACLPMHPTQPSKTGCTASRLHAAHRPFYDTALSIQELSHGNDAAPCTDAGPQRQKDHDEVLRHIADRDQRAGNDRQHLRADGFDHTVIDQCDADGR